MSIPHIIEVNMPWKKMAHVANLGEDWTEEGMTYHPIELHILYRIAGLFNMGEDEVTIKDISESANRLQVKAYHAVKTTIKGVPAVEIQITDDYGPLHSEDSFYIILQALQNFIREVSRIDRDQSVMVTY